MAKTLEEGERFRLSVGATNVLFVNLRERNAVDPEGQLIAAKADPQRAWAFYRWASGAWGVRVWPLRSRPRIARVNREPR